MSPIKLELGENLSPDVIFHIITYISEVLVEVLRPDVSLSSERLPGPEALVNPSLLSEDVHVKDSLI